MDEAIDVAIVGAGPVGAALALALSAAAFKVALIEARASAIPEDDPRTLALSHGSRLILERLGVWTELAAEVTAIQRIHVSQQFGYGRTRMTADEAHVPALGYVVTYSRLAAACAQALAHAGLQVLKGAALESVSVHADQAVATLEGSSQRLAAKLIAVADGGQRYSAARVRAREYRQSALVCDITSVEPHQNRAFERFTPEGPLALLPHRDHWSLVWTTPTARAEELARLDDAAFCAALQNAFGKALGSFRAPGRRLVVPLSLKVAAQTTAPRTILIGNAAQTLHPVAGQGLNLGLRDAWELARTITRDGEGDPGRSEILKAYFSQRRFDRTATILFTDALIRLFCKDIPFLRSMRGASLAALDAIPTAKSFLVRRMLFGARG